MATSYIRNCCDFSCNERMCKTLDRAGVPPESKWRVVILYMRGLAENDYLTDKQKSEIQSLVFKVLKDRDFSEDRYEEVVREKERILAAPCDEKLSSAMRATAELIRDFQGLMLRRKGDVQDLGQETFDIVGAGGDPEEMVERLKDAFQAVVDVMEEDAENLTRISKTDSLTNVANRRALDEYLEDTIAEARARGDAFSLIMLDIDHFKRFNDTYGHRIGDQALAVVGKILRAVGDEEHQAGIKAYFPARYGGEEFAVVLPGVDIARARVIAESIRQHVERYNFVIRDLDGNVLQRGISMTVSAGVGELLDRWKGALRENLVEAADKALYAAKESGRNKVVTSAEL